RIYVEKEDHKKVKTFAAMEDLRLKEAYGLLIKAYLTQDGKVRERKRVSVNLPLRVYKLLVQKAKEYKTTEETLIKTMLELSDRYSELFEGRLF
ncbi:unnamed protein product, partial [marine sediment metagenome]